MFFPEVGYQKTDDELLDGLPELMFVSSEMKQRLDRAVIGTGNPQNYLDYTAAGSGQV